MATSWTSSRSSPRTRQSSVKSWWITLIASMASPPDNHDRNQRYRSHRANPGLRRCPGYNLVRRAALASGLSRQHVLHVVDEGREPRGIQEGRGRLPEEMADDRGTARGHSPAQLGPHDRARRQHLFSLQIVLHRRDRKSVV